MKSSIRARARDVRFAPTTPTLKIFFEKIFFFWLTHCSLLRRKEKKKKVPRKKKEKEKRPALRYHHRLAACAARNKVGRETKVKNKRPGRVLSLQTNIQNNSKWEETIKPFLACFGTANEK